MDIEISESACHATPALICSLCEREISLYDKLTNGTLVCLSCSYKEDYKPSIECIHNPIDFNPQDPDINAELTRIAEIDIERADASVCTVNFIVPEDLWKPIGKLIKANQSSFNAEVVKALGLYITMLNKKPSAVLDFSKLQSIKAESEELDVILGADHPGV